MRETVERTARLSMVLAATALIFACDRGNDAAEDAGDPGDTGSVVDVGSAADALDAGSAGDAGASSDAGVVGDSSAPPLPDGAPRQPEPIDASGEVVELSVEVAEQPIKVAAALSRPTIETPPLPSKALQARDRSIGIRGMGRGGGGPMAVMAEAARAPAATAAAPAAAPTGGGAPGAPAPVRRARRSRVAASSSAASGGPAAGRSSAAADERAPSKSLSPASARPQPARRILTAGAVADVDHRDDYIDYLGRHAAEARSLGLDLSRRVRFRVVDAQRRPVHDAVVTLVGESDQPVSGRTHADGIWDFYPSLLAPRMNGPVSVQVSQGEQRVQAQIEVPAQGDGANYLLTLPGDGRGLPRRLELAFIIDVTGSMGDELRYVNEEVTGIVERVREAVPNTDVRVAATFYRDRNDSVPIEQIPFSSDMSAFTSRMRHVRASGGGDYPEDLSSGLAASFNTLSWTPDGAARVAVVIADAPPQLYDDAQYTYRHAMVDASRRGIRLLPVAASGSNRRVEYLFRAMGALTSTPYAYLTDDSGVGGSHMEADSDNVSREMFSNLLTRLLVAELQGEGMH